MRIAITGSKGQLGTALRNRLGSEDVLSMDLPEHDLTDLASTVATIEGFEPHVVIHTAAMTDVDGCERDREMAYRVNLLGTRNVAVAAGKSSAALVYISTDYVFDGGKDEPYWEHDQANPLSIYARTKWLGEEIVRNLSCRYYVVRIAWLYSEGPRNFVRTVLRLAGERDSLEMASDEVGSPTCASDVAEGLLKLIRQPAYGTYHLPNSGACSRYEWAMEILRLADRTDVAVVPITNYRRLAQVPKRVVLRNFCAAELGITMRPWREALRACFGHGEWVKET